MTWISFHPAVEGTSTWKKLTYIALLLSIFIVMIILVVGSVLFIIEYVISDLELALFAVFQVDACVAILYYSIVLLLSRHRLVAIFENLAKIYRLRKKNHEITIFRSKFNSFSLKLRRKRRKVHIFNSNKCTVRMDVAHLLWCDDHDVNRTFIRVHWFNVIFHENS